MAESFPGTGGADAPSGDPVLPSGLIAPMMAQQAAESIAAAQRSAVMGNAAFEGVMTDAVEKTLNTLIESALEEMEKTKAGRKQLGDIQNWLKTPEAAAQARGEGSRAPSTPTGPGGAPGGAPAPAEGEQAPEHVPTARERYQEGAEQVRGATMGSVARSMSGAVARYASEHTPAYDQDPDTGEYFQRDDQGTEIAGSRVGADSSMGRHIRRVGFIAGNATRIAAGEGLTGSLGAVVSKVAGPIGMAVSAGAMVGHQIEKQNAEASGYRSAFGQEGTGAFAANDRFHEWVAGLQGFGSIGGDRAREQFRSASELGLRGDARSQATDFSSDMYLKFGMSTKDSMQVVQQSIEQGNISLKDFGEAIKEVSRAAVEAGTNSSEAIQSFLSVQRSVASDVVSGPASIDVSKNITHIAEGLGHQVSKALGGAEGVAGVLNANTVQQVAMLHSMNPLSAQYTLQAGGAASTRMASTIIGGAADEVVQSVATILGMTVEEMRSSAMRKTGGSKDVSNDQAQELILEWARGDTAAAQMAISVATQRMQSLGFQVTEQAEVLHIFMQMVVGRFEPHHVSGASGPNTGASGTAGATLVNPYTGEKSKIDYSKEGNGAVRDKALLTSMGYQEERRTTSHADVTMPVQAKPEDEKAFDAYRAVVDKNKGIGNKAIEALLSKKGEDEIADFTKGDAADAKWRVKDASGKSHDVSLAAAINDPRYRAQLISGEASLVGEGKNNTESATVITDWKSKNQSVDKTPDKKTPDKSSSSSDSKGGGHQKVEIVLTGEAKRLFKVNSPSDAQRNGVPAPSGLNPEDIFPYGAN